MSIDDPAASTPLRIPQGPTRRNWTLIALSLALLVTLVIAVLAIGGYLWLARERNTTWSWQNPFLAVEATHVRPDIAVISLAGERTGPLVQEALAAGEPHSAYAALVADPVTGDAERLGLLLPIAQAFEAADALDRAALAYQQMHSLAALSAVLPDFARAQASLDAADGFIRIGKPNAAAPALAQADALVRASPLLAPVQRQQIAQRLSGLYRQIGLSQEAENAARLARNPRQLPDSRIALGPFLPELQGVFTAPQELLDAENQRRLAAAAFIEAWDASGGTNIERARAALATALLAEDGGREAVYAAQLQASPDPAERAAILRSKIAWLTLKYAIARGDLGMSLVTEWTLAQDRIGAQLTRTYDDLAQAYTEGLASLDSTASLDLAQVEILRDRLLRGRLGTYLDYPEQNLALALQQAQEAAADLRKLHNKLELFPSCHLGMWTNGQEEFFVRVQDTTFETRFLNIGAWPAPGDLSASGR